MSAESFLSPGENIRFRSKSNVSRGNKEYQLLMTDKRLILYARRGLIFKSDDLITEPIEGIRSIKYRERGMFSKKGVITIEAATVMSLEGKAPEMKELYHSLLPFLSGRPLEAPKLPSPSPGETLPASIPPPPPPDAGAIQLNCPYCGKPTTYIAQYERRYCYNCQKYI